MPARIPRPGRVLLIAALILPAAGPKPPRPPDIAPAPLPLAAPAGPENGSPMIATAPPALEPIPVAAPTPGPAAPVRTDRLRLSGLMDRDVVGPDRNDIGHVIDVLVDPDGQPRAVLVETGGFLGIGNRRIAVAWTSISFPENKPDGPIRTSMSIDQVRSAPAYQSGGPVIVAVGAALPPAPPGPPPTIAPPPPLPATAAAIAPHDQPVPVADPPPPLPPPARPSTRTR
jgi:hypothetical protein